MEKERALDEELKEQFRGAGLETPLFSLKGVRTWCRLVDAYDADSLTVVMPFAGGLTKFTTRLYGVDTCEMKSKEAGNKELAMRARNRVLQVACGLEEPPAVVKRKEVQKLLADQVVLLWVECMEMDKYGRVLCDVYVGGRGGVNLAELLIAEKLAYAYHGGTKLSEKEQTEVLT